VGPVAKVVPLAEADPAPREAAAPVPMAERSAQGGRNRQGPGPDLQQPARLVVAHHHPAGIARQAPGRFRGNARAPFEDRLARLVRIGQDLGVDVDHDLAALARGAGIEPVMESRLREQGQGIGPLLRHRGRFRGNVPRAGGGPGLPTGPLIQRLAGRGQRLQEQRPHLRLEAPPENHRAVLVVIHVQGSGRVPMLRLPSLGASVHAPPAPNDPLDVGGRARAPYTLVFGPSGSVPDGRFSDAEWF
jgi:hypothetical protein